jgi:hypothetical protein
VGRRAEGEALTGRAPTRSQRNGNLIQPMSPMLQKTIGILCLVAGTLMLAWGYQKTESVEGEFQRIFTPARHNKITWVCVGGAVLCTAGVFSIYLAKK